MESNTASYLMMSLIAAGGLLGCTKSEAEPSTALSQSSEEQAIVDRAAEAVQSMRDSGNFPTFDVYLSEAEGVMVFPRVIRAALFVGGEGGNGVLVGKRGDVFTAPAFYSIGGANFGLQAGYQEATVVLFLTNRSALSSVLERGMELGADASVAAGTIGDTGEARAAVASADVVQLVSVGGVYAGVSLRGALIEGREGFNRDYYGQPIEAFAIVRQGRADNPGANVLKDALSVAPNSDWSAANSFDAAGAN